MIIIRDLTKKYKSKRRRTCVALNGVNLTLPDSGMIFVIGKSGSGKSTLLNMIGGLDSFDEGTIISFGNDLSRFKNKDFYKYRASHVGFIFQDFHLIEELTVAENIRLSAEIANVSAADIKEALAEVDLSGYEHRYPSELSGGEKQRVVIARALIKKPNVLLCDEPVGNLDNKTSEQIMKLLHKISKTKLVVTVSHDMPDAEKYGDRIIELRSGKIVSDSCRREGYKNYIRIDKDGTLILPHNKNLSKEDIEFIKKANRIMPIRDIKQNDDGYDPTTKLPTKDTRVPLRHSRMKAKSVIKLTTSFLGSSKLRAFSTAVISSVMVVLLIILQSFLTFDGNRAVSGILEDESSLMVLQKSIYTNTTGELINNRLNYITDDDMDVLHDVGGRNMKTHTLYSYCLPIINANVKDSTEEETLLDLEFGLKNIFVKNMYGTLACDEQYLIDRFGVDGELKYVGDIHASKLSGGIIITDYIADAMVLNGKGSYDKILNNDFNYSGYRRGQVVAIIDTGYKNKYAEEIEIVNSNTSSKVPGIQLLELDAMTKLMRDISTNLAIGYTLNEDFIKDVSYSEYRNFARTEGFTFTNIHGFGVEIGDIRFMPSYRCNPGELILTTAAINSLVSHSVIGYLNSDDISLDSAPNLDNTEIVSNFSLQKYEFPEQTGELLYEKEFYVNLNERATGNISYMSYDDFYELIYFDIAPIAVYVDGYGSVDDVTEAMEARGFIWPAANSEIITFLTDSVDMFTDLFELLEMITLALVVVFLISYGISNIKANQFQIGVIKAMGGKTGDIAKIFLLENMMITVVIWIMSYFGSILMVDEANNLVLSSFESIVGEKFGKLTIIAFSNELMINAFIITLALGLVATVIPLILLHNIKPIKIIKARE